MSSRRTLILIAAIAIGGLAAFALLNYIGGIEDRANENAERVSVFKVERSIPKGLPGERARAEGYIVLSQIPREFLPSNALASIEQVDGLVALTNLSANQVLVRGMFVDPSVALISFSERLADDEATVTISVDNVRGVAGLLVPGDRVNLLVNGGTFEISGEERTSLPRGPGSPNSAAEATVPIPYGQHFRYMYQGVEILAVGRSTVPQPGETVNAEAQAASSGLITFAVPPDAVARIASASDIYLSLVSPDYVPIAQPMFDPYEVLPAEDPNRLTPYGPTGRE